MADEVVIWICDVCGWEYDPAVGDPHSGIAPERPLKTFPMIGSVPNAA